MVYVANTSFSNTAPGAPLAPAGSTGLQQTLQAISQMCQSSTTLGLLTTKGYSWGDDATSVGGGYSHINPPNKNNVAAPAGATESSTAGGDQGGGGGSGGGGGGGGGSQSGDGWRPIVRVKVAGRSVRSW